MDIIELFAELRSNLNQQYKEDVIFDYLRKAYAEGYKMGQKNVEYPPFRPTSKRGGSSKYKGVTWKTRDQRWEARFRREGKEYYIGYFKTERDAALAYNNYVGQHFGDKAEINLIEDEE